MPLKLVLAGDAMLGRGVDETIAALGPAYPLAALRPFVDGAGLVAVNLECAVTAHPVRYRGPPKAFYFLARPAALDALAPLRVGLCTLANNHALDGDIAGLRDTLALLDARGIAHVGAGLDLAAAQRAAILTVDGVRLGCLACCDHQQDFAASATRGGIDYVDLAVDAEVEALARRVATLAAQVDHAIVSLHWQPNWVPEVAPQYRAVAQRLVAAGARVLWGHSPHHFLAAQWCGDAVVLYSTGGLVDDYALEPRYRNDRQLLFELTLEPGRVSRVRALPLALGYAHTVPAEGLARAWIVRRFTAQCARHAGVVADDGRWLTVTPAARHAAGQASQRRFSPEK